MMRACLHTRAAAAALGLLTGAAVLAADEPTPCPGPGAVRRVLDGADLSRGARARLFDEPLPARLLERALEQPGRGVTERDGKTVHGALLAELPLATIWKAVSDEEHFDLDDQRYMPLVRSDVVARSPDGVRRTVFQVFRKFGISRWWLSDVTVNRELFEASGGRLWEVSWADRMGSAEEPPAGIRELTESIRPLRATHGAWLLVSVGERCTFVDYLVHADPGGFVGALQVMFAAKAVRDTLDGIVRLATEHVPQAHGPGEFSRPDGTPLD